MPEKINRPPRKRKNPLAREKGETAPLNPPAQDNATSPVTSGTAETKSAAMESISELTDNPSPQEIARFCVGKFRSLSQDLQEYAKKINSSLLTPQQTYDLVPGITVNKKHLDKLAEISSSMGLNTGHIYKLRGWFIQIEAMAFAENDPILIGRYLENIKKHLDELVAIIEGLIIPH